MQVSYSSLFVCFDLYPRHIAPALMLQRTPPQADQDRKDEPVFGAGILSRLRCKTAFLSRQKHDVKSGAFPLCQLQIGTGKLHPELVSEWSEKNLPLTPDEYRYKCIELAMIWHYNKRKRNGNPLYATACVKNILIADVVSVPRSLKRTVHNPYTSMIEDEMLQRLEQSRESSKNGNYRNADDVISDMREK